jgi:hypothetical protein
MGPTPIEDLVLKRKIILRLILKTGFSDCDLDSSDFG